MASIFARYNCPQLNIQRTLNYLVKSSPARLTKQQPALNLSQSQIVPVGFIPANHSNNLF
jgi:hypothetical protein